jgi:pimeloyl-ACP methyl ester carboxylesterase
MTTFLRDWNQERNLHRLLCILTALLALLPGAFPADAQTTAPSRPILFVHGWCGSASDWAPLYATLFRELPANLYPDQTVFWIQYNSMQDTINFWTENNPSLGAAPGNLQGIDESTIPTEHPNARFFVLEFIDPKSGSTDDADVTKISILNKAYDISQVIKHITAIAQIPSVNIVAHSMGGLDARAYVANMASQGACYDYVNNIPAYYGSCAPGTGNAAYASDVAHIITVDTPHAGAPLAANWLAPLLADAWIIDACLGYSSTNKIELTPLSYGGWAGLIEALNFNGLAIAEKSPHPNPVPIQAIQDYFTSTSPAWTQVPSPSDDIVTEGSQSITANLPAPNSNASLVDLPIPYNLPSGWLTDSSDVSQTLACWEPDFDPSLPVLHFMTCLGALTEVQFTIGTQLINDTVPWISSWTVAPATLSLGGSVTIEYTAADYSTFQLSRAELWRAPDAGGQPGTWTELSSQTKTLTGNGPTQVTLFDTPPLTGKYWYGTHLFDTGGNEALEPYTVQVTVNPPPQNIAPTVLVTPLLSSITTAQSLTTVVGVGGPNGEPTPTGSVTLTSGTYASAPTSLSSGGATIVVPAGSLPTGTDALTVTYTPDAASSSVYTSASGSTDVTVSPASTVPTISSFIATPANVSGGWTITYTVTLTGPAPTGGAQISFASSTSLDGEAPFPKGT